MLDRYFMGGQNTDILNIIPTFQRLKQQGRLNHAYILSHADERLLVKTVQDLGAGLLCKHPLADGRACEKCDSCLQFSSDNHPSWTWLLPDGASLKISQMRVALRAANLKSSGSPIQIVVFQRADKLTTEAGNAILKWVEEPADGRLFFFLTPTFISILPTLRSRCMHIVLRASSHGNADDAAQAQAAIFGMAENLQRFAEMQDLVLEWGNTWLERGDQAWHFISARIAKMNFSNDEILILVDLMTALLRDVSAVRYDCEPDVFISYQAALEHLAVGEFGRWCAEFAIHTAGVRRRLYGHVNATLALEAALIEATAKVGHGEDLFRAR